MTQTDILTQYNEAKKSLLRSFKSEHGEPIRNDLHIEDLTNFLWLIDGNEVAFSEHEELLGTGDEVNVSVIEKYTFKGSDLTCFIVESFFHGNKEIIIFSNDMEVTP